MMQDTHDQTNNPSSTPKKRRWAMMKGIKHVTGAVAGLFSVLFYVLLVGMFVGGGFFGGSGSSTNVLFGTGEKKVALLDITGIILEGSSQDFGFGESGVTTSRSVLSTLESIKEDEDVVALVVRIDSPGGSVTASDEILQTFLRFKKETNMPLVMSFGDIAASGGYYVGLAGDTIFSSPTTLTGSIGTIIESVNVSELAEKVGVRGVVIKSGEYKSMLNPLEEVRPDDVALLQRIVDEGQQQFVANILNNRPTIAASQLSELADGRVLSGRQAKESGLVDALGSLYDAVDFAKKRAGVEEAQVVVYGKKGILESFFGSVAQNVNLTSSFDAVVDPWRFLSGKPAYMYLAP